MVWDNAETFSPCTMVTGSKISALIFGTDGVKRIFIHFTGTISLTKRHWKIVLIIPIMNGVKRVNPNLPPETGFLRCISVV